MSKEEVKVQSEAAEEEESGLMRKEPSVWRKK